MNNDANHIERLYKKILKHVNEKITHVQLNGDENLRYLGNLNISFAFV
jgi:cysteine sulfinate desulfinase/cysteine desulfurase-like protein